MMADAWATALNALGPEKGISIANAQDVAVMYIMQKENMIIKSKSWNYSD
jgi:thiamine biosynthesis lipoprotein